LFEVREAARINNRVTLRNTYRHLVANSKHPKLYWACSFVQRNRYLCFAVHVNSSPDKLSQRLKAVKEIFPVISRLRAFQARDWLTVNHFSTWRIFHGYRIRVSI